MTASAESRHPRIDPVRPRPFRNVLIATDLSPRSTGVAARALRLPLAPDALVQLCHVVGEVPGSRRSALEALRAVEAQAQAARDTLRSEGGTVVPIVRRLAWGDPATEIALEARRTATGLIVVGRRGVPARAGGLSTTRGLLEVTGCPVLVVGNESSEPYRRPLVTTDLGLADVDLLLLASRATATSAERIRVLHAFDVGFEGRRGLLPRGELTPFGERFRAAARARLDEFLLAAAVEGVTWMPEVEPGPVVDAVRRTLGDSDLVVLGRRGRVGLERLAHGSVSETLLGAIACDLLIARPDRCVRALPPRGASSAEPGV
jgi:nucleotide-binding universal stress UspA family protein